MSKVKHYKLSLHQEEAEKLCDSVNRKGMCVESWLRAMAEREIYGEKPSEQAAEAWNPRAGGVQVKPEAKEAIQRAIEIHARTFGTSREEHTWQEFLAVIQQHLHPAPAAALVAALEYYAEYTSEIHGDGGDRAIEALKAYRHRAAADKLAFSGRWISVAERLPEVGTLVQAAFDGRVEQVRFDVAGDCLYWVTDEGEKVSVTHWAEPLPHPEASL